MALSVMIYGSLWAEFIETKYNGHIHRYEMMHDIETKTMNYL